MEIAVVNELFNQMDMIRNDLSDFGGAENEEADTGKRYDIKSDFLGTVVLFEDIELVFDLLYNLKLKILKRLRIKEYGEDMVDSCVTNRLELYIKFLNANEVSLSSIK